MAPVSVLPNISVGVLSENGLTRLSLTAMAGKGAPADKDPAPARNAAIERRQAGKAAEMRGATDYSSAGPQSC